jgi:hypothetical protein
VPSNPAAYAFPSLIGDTASQSFAFIGTGLSTPNCPTVADLIQEIPAASNQLKLPSGYELIVNLYEWAEKTLQHLQSIGDSEDHARYKMATALGLLEDQRWFGTVGLPLRGNTPRHRAIARLIAEGRFSGAYSLNWDALLERTLESVGLGEIRVGTDTPPSKRPTSLTAYARVISHDHQVRIANRQRVFPLFKPHGCVEELSCSRDENVIFKITKSDLEKQSQEDQKLAEGQVNALAGGSPILAIGWRAGEEYLRRAIQQTQPATGRDAFVLASRTWDPDTHGKIAKTRNTTEEQSHAVVSKGTSPTSDSLFPWLFARYALRKVRAAASALHKAKIDALQVALDDPEQWPRTLGIVQCCDNWLPSWVRLCWQIGAMEGCDPATNEIIRPYDIPTVPPDVHIPLGGIVMVRKDLEAAAELLATVGDSGRYDYQTFHGALWDAKTLHLILPLPTWGDPLTFNDLAGLKNLFTAFRQHGLGKVREVSLLPLSGGANSPDMSVRYKLAALVAKRMPHSRFADGMQLKWMELTELAGVN